MDIKQSMQGLFSFGEYSSKSVMSMNVIGPFVEDGDVTTPMLFASMLENTAQEGVDLMQYDDSKTDSQHIINIATSLTFDAPYTELSSSEFCKIYKAGELQEEAQERNIIDALSPVTDDRSEYSHTSYYNSTITQISGSNTTKAADTVSLSSITLHIEPNVNQATSVMSMPLYNIQEQSTNLIESGITENIIITPDIESDITEKMMTTPETESDITEKMMTTPEGENSITEKLIITQTIENTNILIPYQEGLMIMEHAANPDNLNGEREDNHFEHNIINSESAVIHSTVPHDQVQSTTPVKLQQFQQTAIDADTTIKNTLSQQADFFTGLGVREEFYNYDAHATEQAEVGVSEVKFDTTSPNKVQEVTFETIDLKKETLIKTPAQESEVLENIKFNLSKSVIEDKKVLKFILKPKELGRIEIKFENLDTKIEGVQAKSSERTNVSIAVESKEAFNLLHTMKSEIEAALSSKLGADSPFSLELYMHDKNQNNTSSMDQDNKNTQMGFAYEEDENIESKYTGEISLTDGTNINLVI
jgi:hypothetical protein